MTIKTLPSREKKQALWGLFKVQAIKLWKKEKKGGSPENIDAQKNRAMMTAIDEATKQGGTNQPTVPSKRPIAAS